MYQFENIKITEGNAFSLLIPLKKRTYVAQRPIDEDIDILNLQSVVVKFGGVEYPCTLQEDGVLVDFPADLKCGTYDLVLTADYMDNAIRAAYFEAVTIVSYNYQSDAHNFVQGSPIVMQPAFVIYNLSDAELEQLKQQYREAIAAAEAAEEAAEQAKEEFVEKAAMLDNVAQQGANPLATLSATQAAVEALAPVAQAAQAYNTGKTELATNITAKGVPASADETLPELAEKVSAIAQNSYTIDGGELYAKQLFGSLTTPNYWNLYEVLDMLLSDGRLVNYGGIMLAEYYKGYDSLTLSGAGAGGAYVVSDMENGQFKMYTEDTTHTWAKEFDGKGNRWVAYCFADEYHDFQITDTNTSPRSIFIGRKVGTITNLVNGRASQIAVPDGNELKCVDANGKTQNFGQCVVLRNIKEQTKTAIQLTSNIDSVYLEADTLGTSSSMTQLLSKTSNTIKSIIVKAREIKGYVILDTSSGGIVTQTEIASVHIDGVESCEYSIGFFSDVNGAPSYVDAHYDKLKEIVITNTEQLTLRFYCAGSAVFPNTTIFFGYKTNDRSKAVSIINTYAALQVKDVQLKEDWCKPLDVSYCPMLTEANMYAHILQRLKQDEPDCGDGVTITLGATNLAKLTSADSVQLLDDLTNIYGYTFA